MSRKKSHHTELEVDHYMNDLGDEIMIAIRTSDGSKLTPQDILDAATYTCLESLGAEIKPVTAQDIKENPDLH